MKHKSDNKKSFLTAANKPVDLYAPHFNHSDLVAKLSMLKSRKKSKGCSSMFMSFDSASAVPKRRTKSKRKNSLSISQEHKSKCSRKTVSLLNECRGAVRKLSSTEAFLQSDMLPLFTPGANPFYRYLVKVNRNIISK